MPAAADRTGALSKEAPYSAAMKPAIDPKLLANPLFQRVMKDALAIQERFVAEPVYAKTDRGRLKSAGVSEVQQAKTGKKPR